MKKIKYLILKKSKYKFGLIIRLINIIKLDLLFILLIFSFQDFIIYIYDYFSYIKLFYKII